MSSQNQENTEETREQTPTQNPDHAQDQDQVQEQEEREADKPDTKEQSELRRARREAAKYRTERNQITEQYEKLTDTIGRAFGFIKDETTLEELQARVEQATQREKDATVRLAVFQAAHHAGADPERLLDSNSFLKSLTNIDPDDSEALATHIKTYVADHQYLRTAPQGGTSAVEHATGSGSTTPNTKNPATMTMADLNRLYHQDREAYRKAIAQLRVN